MKKYLFRILITFGSILWAISCIGESNGYQPLSTIGMFVSIPIYGLGVYLWFDYYKTTCGHYPKFIKAYRELIEKMKKNPFYGIFFLFKNILRFYAFMVAFTMGLIFIGYITIGHSDSVKATQKYCENLPEIINKTGKIKYYGILRNVHNQYNSEEGNSKISLILVGQKGNFTVDSKLEINNSEWKVTELKLTEIKTGANTVYN